MGASLSKPRRANRIFTAILCCRQVQALQLARRGVGIGAKDYQGCSPLFYAATRGWLDVMRALIRSGANPNSHDNDGEIVLMWAADEGQTEAIELLIRSGADVNAVSGDSGYTALIWAAQYGRTDTVKSLLAHGAEIDAMDRWGQTALARAMGGKHTETVEALLTAGAQLTPATGVLNAAAYGGYPEIVARLVELGVDVNTVDDTGATALKWASESGNEEVVQILLAAGARE
jgi:ankyrin repeat protein